MRIGLDLDGVAANFLQGFIDQAKLMGLEDSFPNSWRAWRGHQDASDEDFKKVWDAATPKPSFWLGLEPLINPKNLPFSPAVYCTARPTPTRVTMAWLDAHEFPWAPVITVPYGSDKTEALRDAEIDYFIDDNAWNYQKINAGGRTKCLLWDTPANQDVFAPLRIFMFSQLTNAGLTEAA
jgi:hypothetical protein